MNPICPFPKKLRDYALGAAELDLVITDVIMPGGMHGVALAQQIHARHPDVPVIYASGFPASALTERSQLHVDGPLLHKPYRQEQLLEIVYTVLAYRQHPAP